MRHVQKDGIKNEQFVDRETQESVAVFLEGERDASQVELHQEFIGLITSTAPSMS